LITDCAPIYRQINSRRPPLAIITTSPDVSLNAITSFSHLTYICEYTYILLYIQNGGGAGARNDFSAVSEGISNC